MGLTIHYRLRTALAKPAAVRQLVEVPRQQAQDLPFQEVGEVLELTGAAAAESPSPAEDEHCWFKIQAGQYVQVGEQHYRVDPRHIIGFSTWPGEGCEAVNFGFCQYPAQLLIPTAAGRKKKLPTHLPGWRWPAFVRASMPATCGVVG